MLAVRSVLTLWPVGSKIVGSKSAQNPTICHDSTFDAWREPPLPILVTGISGVAGYNALPYLQARYPGQVVGIRQR